MKEPKTYKYPRLYYFEDNGYTAIKIFYPDGLMERMYLSMAENVGEIGEWSPKLWGGAFTLKEAIEQEKYHWNTDYNKVLTFLGEIK